MDQCAEAQRDAIYLLVAWAKFHKYAKVKTDKQPAGGEVPRVKGVCLFWLGGQLGLLDDDGGPMSCHRVDRGLTCFGRHEEKGLKGVSAKVLARLETAKIHEDKKVAIKAGVEAAIAAGTLK